MRKIKKRGRRKRRPNPWVDEYRDRIDWFSSFGPCIFVRGPDNDVVIAVWVVGEQRIRIWWALPGQTLKPVIRYGRWTPQYFRSMLPGGARGDWRLWLLPNLYFRFREFSNGRMCLVGKKYDEEIWYVPMQRSFEVQRAETRRRAA